MKLIGLVDVNNFFVSCERVFNPQLHNKPLVVLSNNDGCVVARSQEAKDMGVRMCAPWFEVKHLPTLEFRSSNYSLYDGMSARVVAELKSLTHEVIPYSVDEAFILKTVDNYSEASDYGQYISHKVKQDLGLPVCVGLAPTKTLAKISNHIAKKNRQFNNCYVWGQNPHYEKQHLRETDVGEIWGVGRKLVQKLKSLQIHTMEDLKNADPQFIRSRFSVVLMKTVLELNGEACIENTHNKVKESLIYSRMFSRSLTDPQEFETAITDYVFTAVGRLRAQKRAAKKIQVYSSSSYFRDDFSYFYGDIVLDMHTDDPLIILKKVKEKVKEKYQSGIEYNRAGIVLHDLIPVDYAPPLEVFSPENKERKKLYEVCDRIHQDFGNTAVRWASQGLRRDTTKEDWHMKSDQVSPSYLHNWKELPQATLRL